MISSLFTQITHCWSLTCSPATLSTTEEVHQSDKSTNDDDDNSFSKKRRSKSYGIGKVLSTLTSSTAVSFSSWTDSFLSNNNSSSNRHRHEELLESPMMVFRHNGSKTSVHQQVQNSSETVASTSIRRKSNSIVEVVTGVGPASSMKKNTKKNELLHPISPYDEIPTIRDLFEQLSPHQGQQEELRQERQDRKKNYRRSVHQQRDRAPAPAEVSSNWSRSRDGAHEVPIVIEMPKTPTYSEDSELSLDECLRQYEEDQRDQRSLTPHPSYEDDLNCLPTALDVHNLYHAFVMREQELTWPSDEDSVAPQKETSMTKNRKKTTNKVRRHHRVRLV